jgi:hypothetical protein
MTRLRNYLGQRVIIPNRNIALVGKYLKGAQEVHVDVAMPDLENARQATGHITEMMVELERQFQGVILSTPTAPPPFTLATGECFVRVELRIWPQQQWVIDQQVLPRVRERMKACGIDIPGDRVVAFYHARKQHPVRKSGLFRRCRETT